LKKQLLSVVPRRLPIIRGEKVNEIAGIEYELEYEVLMAPTGHLNNLERRMSENLIKTDNTKNVWFNCH